MLRPASSQRSDLQSCDKRFWGSRTRAAQREFVELCWPVVRFCGLGRFRGFRLRQRIIDALLEVVPAVVLPSTLIRNRLHLTYFALPTPRACSDGKFVVLGTREALR